MGPGLLQQPFTQSFVQLALLWRTVAPSSFWTPEAPTLPTLRTLQFHHPHHLIRHPILLPHPHLYLLLLHNTRYRTILFSIDRPYRLIYCVLLQICRWTFRSNDRVS